MLWGKRQKPGIRWPRFMLLSLAVTPSKHSPQATQPGAFHRISLPPQKPTLSRLAAAVKEVLVELPVELVEVQVVVQAGSRL